MDERNICLYYCEPTRSWIKRGYANHLFLYISYQEKSFQLVKTYSLMTNRTTVAIEVKRKSDIYDLISRLQEDNFTDLNKVQVI